MFEQVEFEQVEFGVGSSDCLDDFEGSIFLLQHLSSNEDSHVVMPTIVAILFTDRIAETVRILTNHFLGSLI